jgi:hypothetical protein
MSKIMGSSCGEAIDSRFRLRQRTPQELRDAEIVRDGVSRWRRHRWLLDRRGNADRQRSCHPREARRIAANIAKLPELLRSSPRRDGPRLRQHRVAAMSALG